MKVQVQMGSISRDSTKVKAFVNPSTDIMRTKPGQIEVALRGLSVVLPLLTVLAASSCQSHLAELVGKLVAQTSSASNLIKSVSYAIIVYQLFAIGQLFLRIRIAYTNVLRWSLFYLVDLVVILLTVFGYLYAGVYMTIYSVSWSQLASVDADVGSVNIATKVTTAFSFLNLLLCIGLIIYFYVARCKYRWPTHGELSMHSISP